MVAAVFVWVAVATVAEAAPQIGSMVTPPVEPAPLIQIDVGTPDPQPEYRLGSGDLLEMSVFPGDEMRGEYRIGTGGEVLVPLIGRVKVAGLTLVEATALLESRLRGGFYRDPQVVLLIKEYRSRRVNVLGAVTNPGAIVVYQPTRLLSVLSEAGGVKENAAERLVLVREGGPNGVTSVQTVGLRQLLDKGDLRENVWVNPGDMVYVPGRNQVYMLGAVDKPGAYGFQDGMTLLKVISLAGGLKPTAAEGRVSLIRRASGQNDDRTVDVGDILSKEAPDIPLEPEDIIVVPEGLL